MEPIEQLDKLAEGHSIQSKRANQIWLFLILFSFVTLTGEKNKNGEFAFFFGLNISNEFTFYYLSLLIISALNIAFSSSMIQAIRVRKLIQTVFENNKDQISIEIHTLDYVDSIISPAYNRVSPIADFILGKRQFRNDNAISPFTYCISRLFYVLLKLITYIALFIIPGYVFIVCYNKVGSDFTGVLKFAWPIAILSIISSLILFIGDIVYSYNAISAGWKERVTKN